jgi:hypothetical protein
VAEGGKDAANKQNAQALKEPSFRSVRGPIREQVPLEMTSDYQRLPAMTEN